mmetsp:Transcript_27955/g.41290  ORF Transcript_27955/g.41290 Transcript_27955/m.41290 type:complete len:91 (+) Transcript_27955:447-719(+)
MDGFKDLEGPIVEESSIDSMEGMADDFKDIDGADDEFSDKLGFIDLDGIADGAEEGYIVFFGVFVGLSLGRVAGVGGDVLICLFIITPSY